MILEILCTKCQDTIRFDVGDRTREEALELIRKQNCPGNHVELGLNNFWDESTVVMVEGAAPTNEEVMEDLRVRYKYVYPHEEFGKGDNPFSVEGFCYGMCIAKEKATGNKFTFDFKRLPSGGRVYYANG